MQAVSKATRNTGASAEGVQSILESVAAAVQQASFWRSRLEQFLSTSASTLSWMPTLTEAVEDAKTLDVVSVKNALQVFADSYGKIRPGCADELASTLRKITLDALAAAVGLKSDVSGQKILSQAACMIEVAKLAFPDSAEISAAAKNLKVVMLDREKLGLITAFADATQNVLLAKWENAVFSKWMQTMTEVEGLSIDKPINTKIKEGTSETFQAASTLGEAPAEITKCILSRMTAANDLETFEPEILVTAATSTMSMAQTLDRNADVSKLTAIHAVAEFAKIGKELLAVPIESASSPHSAGVCTAARASRTKADAAISGLTDDEVKKHLVGVAEMASEHMHALIEARVTDAYAVLTVAIETLKAAGASGRFDGTSWLDGVDRRADTLDHVLAAAKAKDSLTSVNPGVLMKALRDAKEASRTHEVAKGQRL